MNKTALRGALALLTVSALVLTGCTSTANTVKTSADETTAAVKPAGGSSGGSKAPAPAEPAAARVGSTISLKGNSDGSELAVTVVKVIDPAKSTSEFIGPDNGKRWVAVQFKLVNTGTIAYDDSPSNGAKLVDSLGQQYDSTITDGIEGGQELPSSMKVAPHGNALGFLVFEVPKATKIAHVQFGMDSGFAETGEWTIR